MSDPFSTTETVLLAAVGELFRGATAELHAEPELESVSDQDIVMGTIGFGGAEARGAITLTGTVAAWRRLVPRAMGAPVGEDMLCDSVGELANMLAGRFRNALLRLGVEVLVATPIATRATRLAVHRNDSASVRWHDLAFAGAEFRLRFDLSFAEGFAFTGRESAVVIPNEQDLVLF